MYNLQIGYESRANPPLSSQPPPISQSPPSLYEGVDEEVCVDNPTIVSHKQE